MSESKQQWTPGPWEAVDGIVNAENGSVISIADCHDATIPLSWGGTDYTGRDYRLANAKLIAAAPELVEALRIAEAKLVELEAYVGGGDDEIYVEGAILTIRAALAKAGA